MEATKFTFALATERKANHGLRIEDLLKKKTVTDEIKTLQAYRGS